MQLLVARAGCPERELVHAVSAERGMRVAVDETGDCTQAATVQLRDLAAERRQVAHSPDGFDGAVGAEHERVFEQVDLAESRSA
jgi:hypothetical protein